jgi:peptide/nickel transport system substrate-binding protein
VDGAIATHFIDPSFGDQGFDQSGGTSFDPFPSPGFAGDVTKAKELMKDAGYANGMYSGPQVTMVADNTPPGSDTAKVVAADLAKIGIDPKIISVTHSTMYTKYCNVPRTSRTSARTSAGCRTSTSRRRSSTRRSTGRTSFRRTTPTGRS